MARSAEDSEPGRFPQVSGIRFTFDASRPAGSRVIDVTVNGLPLDDKKKYTLATANFLADGGDGYAVLQGKRMLITPEQGKSDFDVMRLAIAGRPVAPKVEGRIKRIDSVQSKKADCPE